MDPDSRGYSEFLREQNVGYIYVPAVKYVEIVYVEIAGARR